MKRLALVLVLWVSLACITSVMIVAIGSLCFADMNPYVAGIDTAGGGSCDDCSGDLMFSAHFENSSDITSGTPCGCTDGTDETWSANDAFNSTYYSDGSYSIESNDTAYETTDISLNSSFSALEEEGKMTFELYLTENGTSNESEIFRLTNGTDYIYVALMDTNDLKLRYVHATNGAADATANCNLSLSTWYTVTVNWNVTGTTDKISVNANSVDGTNSATIYGSWTTDINTLNIVDPGFAVELYYIDDLALYATSDL